MWGSPHLKHCGMSCHSQGRPRWRGDLHLEADDDDDDGGSRARDSNLSKMTPTCIQIYSTNCPQMAVWGHLGAVLGPSWGHVGPGWAILGPSWGNLGLPWATLDHLGPSWAILEPSWSHLGSIWFHFGSILGLLLGPKSIQKRSLI